ncbi:MAG: 1-acyl-sn-glycerol-3-phosphate acyltransferase [Actinobacteria bacterium]|nr:1-acyl-sn-glycerol-3-phosphate acyltransferase [Actinomycetota bacterium]MBV9255406.1 1-acyl-sn-glycerol-3-phosphate acyltransferase [Actinomycetota bacterium]
MRPDLLFYRGVRFILHAFSKLFWRLSIEGRENLPKHGAYVLAPVHRSNVDTVLACTITTRRMHFMGKASMWKYGFGVLWNALGAYPVHRGSADREALRKTADMIATGEPVVIFPEGTRQSGPEVQPLFDGAAYVAAKTGVPIVPVGIGGSEKAMPKGSKFIHPTKVHIVVGAPIDPPRAEEGKRTSRRAVHELTEQLHTEIQKLFDQAQATVTGTPSSRS